MTNHGGIEGEKLRQYVEKIERLEAEKQTIVEEIREVTSMAKSDGFDTKIMKQVIKLRKMDRNDLAEQEELLDIYKHALGLAVELEDA